MVKAADQEATSIATLEHLGRRGHLSKDHAELVGVRLLRRSTVAQKWHWVLPAV